MYGADNQYNTYQSNQCPYCAEILTHKAEYSRQFAENYMPFDDEIENNWRQDFSTSDKGGGFFAIKDYGPEPFVVNIEEVTKQNDTFRTALWTGKYFQLTLMSIKVGEEIGLEIHPDLDQFLRIEEGQGIVKMGDSKDSLDFQEKVYEDFIIIIPAGKWHNLINTGYKPLKLYSIYAPPQHPRGTVHETKADAEAAEKHEH
jgi:mannose-6-phosphate isomerase-like protein (cupin superfamily)